MSITDIGKQAAEATSNNDGGSSGGSASADENDYERIDVSDMGFVKPHAGPTAIGGTVVGLRYFPPFEDGEYDDEGRGFAGLVLEDPYIPDDDSMENVALYKSESETGDDYKVVNTEDERTDTYEIGVSVGNMFEAEEVDEFDHDRIILKLETSAGRSVIRTLDVSGRFNADLIRTDDGSPKIFDHGYPEFNDGLVEKCPDNDEDHYEPPQYIRDPELRPDVEGRDVTVILQHMKNVVDDYDGNSYWSTILVDLDEERQNELASDYAESEYFAGDEPEDFIDDVDGTDMLRLAPTNEFEPSEDLVDDTHYTMWRFLEDDELDRLREEQGVDA